MSERQNPRLKKRDSLNVTVFFYSLPVCTVLQQIMLNVTGVHNIAFWSWLLLLLLPLLLGNRK